MPMPKVEKILTSRLILCFFGTCLAIIQLSFTIQPPTVPIREKHIPHGQSTWHSLQKGRLIQGLYKPIYGNCAIYFYPGVYQ